jgi:hypothetical protein
MNIGIVGKGTAAESIGSALLKRGHNVLLGGLQDVNIKVVP